MHPAVHKFRWRHSDSHFVYAEIPAGLARRLTAQMNANGPTKLFPDQHDTGNSAMREYERIDKLYRQTRMLEWERYLSENGQFGTDAQMTLGSITEPLTMGYVTHDACPGRGDDIEHIPGTSPLSRDSCSAAEVL